MGLFDRFRNLKKDSEYEEEVDPRQQQFDAICNDIEDNFEPENIENEDHLQVQLLQWISARYDYLIVEREQVFYYKGEKNRADILINNQFAFEVKLVDNDRSAARDTLRKLWGQLKEYQENFEYVCAILHFQEQHIFDLSRGYVEEHKQDGVRTIDLVGRKKGQEPMEQASLSKEYSNYRPKPRTSERYIRKDPKNKSFGQKLVSGMDKVSKGMKKADEVMGQLSGAMGNDEDYEERPTRRKIKRRRSNSGTQRQSSQNRRRRNDNYEEKEEEDYFGMKKFTDNLEKSFGSFDKSLGNFGPGSSKKSKKRKKSDDDDPFGLDNIKF